MLSVIERRGPDEACSWREENVVLALSRLAVRDLSTAGRQPMVTADGRYHLVYNGELYNDAELRRELSAAGAVPGGFQGQCDSETVLQAFAHWGTGSFAKLRGMFALAIYDSREHVLHLARDPHGIKPLYYHLGASELTFASEPRAILAHPGIEARPYMPMVSAYLSTVRSVLGRDTLFLGLHALMPGERARYDAKSGKLGFARFHHATPVDAFVPDEQELVHTLRSTVEDSIARHVTADVPVSAFLSGGLDSSIICRILADDHGHALRTWCAGGRTDAGVLGEDLGWAARVAAELGAEHTEILVDRRRFESDWSWMVGELGLPLSTPNEVAIHAIAKDMRAKGCVVALSGEGADELFAGYQYAVDQAALYCADPGDARSGGRFQFEAASWIPASVKQHLFGQAAWDELGQDSYVHGYYDEVFERSRREAGSEAPALEAHLRFLRHVNLTGLLQRFDTATMLASIEGRTPFADVEVLRVAERLPISFKRQDPSAGSGGTALASKVRNKLILRSTWADRLPQDVCERPKQSFPLPFQEWLRDQAGAIETSRFMQEHFEPELCQQISIRPEEYFQFAWPLINIALWADCWWK